jgi:hypothetical protein
VTRAGGPVSSQQGETQRRVMMLTGPSQIPLLLESLHDVPAGHKCQHVAAKRR